MNRYRQRDNTNLLTLTHVIVIKQDSVMKLIGVKFIHAMVTVQTRTYCHGCVLEKANKVLARGEISE